MIGSRNEMSDEAEKIGEERVNENETSGRLAEYDVRRGQNGGRVLNSSK